MLSEVCTITFFEACRFSMKLTRNIFLPFFVAVALVACHSVEEIAPVVESNYPDALDGEVRIMLPEGNTRAMIASDGKNYVWQAGDRFTLIARNSAGENAFTPCRFIYWVNNMEKGHSFFRGTPDAAMSDGTYTYYAVYPSTVTLNDLTASFTVPATQNGTYNSDIDFMVAKGSGGKLITCDDDPETAETMNDMNFTFKHQLHALRFIVPQNNLSAAIRKVHILFSENVVGDISVNIDTGSVTTTPNANKLTIDFGAGNEKQAGDEFWVWLLPQSATFSRAVDIRFEDANGNYSTRQLVTFPQVCSKGSVTPIRINVPSQVGYTYLDYTTDDSQLGEPVTNLHLSLPTGYYFSDYSNYKNITADSQGKYTYIIFNDMFDTTLRNAELPLDYESANAYVPTKVKLENMENTVNVGGRTENALTTPYLFSEDFSGVSSFNYNMDKHTATIETKSLSEYGLNGWYGGRVGSNGNGANGAMGITVRHETVAQYRGRLDSPGLTHIKQGKSVNVKITFDAVRSNEWAYMDYGIGRVSDGGSLSGGDGISVASVRLDPTTNEDATYTAGKSTYTSGTFTGVTRDNRLSWVVSRDYKAGNSFISRTWYIYLDNICVTIVP